MAPAQVSSQQLIAQATQKLADAMAGVSEPPNEFAKTLLELLEVSAKINQFEELNTLAADEAASEEAKKWRDISMMTTQFMMAQLSEQRQRLVEKLRHLSQSGASLVKDPTNEEAVKPEPKAEKPSTPQVKAVPTAVKPPPGLSAPPGLAPPPGLASAGTGREGAALPEDVEYTSVKKQAPWNTKKQAAAKENKDADDGWTVKTGAPRKANSKKQVPQVAPAAAPAAAPATSVFLNFDAYDSD